jgi:hypothetical protein
MKIGLISVFLAIVPTLANAAGGCGTGCHTTAGGACVVDGWETGSFVWNECPARVSPPPCAYGYVWRPRPRACFRVN